MTTDGKPYYQNVITRITSWDPPIGWKEPSPSIEDTGDVHEETAKGAVETISGGKGDKTDDGSGEPLVCTCRWIVVVCTIVRLD